MILDLQSEGDQKRFYPLAIGMVLPRPIALVSTVGLDGRRNVAPFSFFNMVSATPPILMFCPALNRDGRDKDTLRNVRETNEFVVAVVTEGNVAAVNHSSAAYPPGVDEFEKTGLTPLSASVVKAALVAESPINMECRLLSLTRFGDGPGAGCLVLGRILRVHVGDDLFDRDGRIDEGKLAAVGRLGGLRYCRTRDVFELPRPSAD